MFDRINTAVALISGIVYCPDATAKAEALSDELFVEPDELGELHLDAAEVVHLHEVEVVAAQPTEGSLHPGLPFGAIFPIHLGGHP